MYRVSMHEHSGTAGGRNPKSKLSCKHKHNDENDQANCADSNEDVFLDHFRVATWYKDWPNYHGQSARSRTKFGGTMGSP